MCSGHVHIACFEVGEVDTSTTSHHSTSLSDPKQFLLKSKESLNNNSFFSKFFPLFSLAGMEMR